jgi:hypothetical protein
VGLVRNIAIEFMVIGAFKVTAPSFWTYYEERHTEIRDLSFMFPVDQLSRRDFISIWENYEKVQGPGSFSNLTTETRHDMVTYWHHNQTQADWDGIQMTLCSLERQIECVEVDFASAYCSAGCCRRFQDCTGIDRWIVKLAPKSLNITGLMATAQATFNPDDFTSGKLYELEDLKRLYNLRLAERSEETKWDAWKIEPKESTCE